MWKHSQIHHQGVAARFRMTMTGRFKGCLVRLEDEATRIRETKAQILMNSQAQWHQPPLNRVVVVRGNINQDQIGAAPDPNLNLNLNARGRGGRGRGRGRRGRGRN
jgi:hypothetical protein